MIRKIGACLLACIIISVSLTGCGAPKLTRYDASFLELFDTMTQIVGYADSKEDFTKFSQFIYDNLKEYHQLYDIFNNYDGINNIKTINDNAGKAPVKVDKRIIDLLLFAKQMYQKTDGQLNIALGAVTNIWLQYREAGIADPDNAKLPPADMLKEAAEHTDINKMIINEADSTVFLEDPEMSLDVGGVGKGYAVEQVCRLAEQNGYTSALVSVGGNVRAIGGKGGEDQPWSVGIQNPDTSSSSQNLCIVNLKGASLVTSGIYERYYTVDGKNYHHIIDPDTLFPETYFASVSIITRDSGEADALAKIINMPYEDGLKIIEATPGTEALWVTMDGKMLYSPGFKDYIKK